MSLRHSLYALREVTTHPLNIHRPVAAAFGYLRWNIGRRILPTEYLLPLADGARLIISSKQNFGTLVYTCSLWDFEEMVFLLHLLRPGDLFLDIGSNVGGYSVLASAVAGARSIAFEPVADTFDQLCRNIRLNGIEDRVRCLQIGVGDVEKTVSMTVDLGGMNHVVAGQWNGATIEVPIKRIDDVIGHDPCRLVKLDTEGFELNVLHGGPHTFADPTLAALIVELNGSGDRYGQSDEAVHAEIVRYGFTPCRYDVVKRTLRPLPTFNRDRFNTLYVRDLGATADVVAQGRRFTVRGQAF